MTKAYVLITNESGSENSIITHLNKIDNVKEAFGSFGPYDIITKINADNLKQLENNISKKIRKIPKIRSTLTLLVNEVGSFSKINDIEKEILETHLVRAFIIIHCSVSDEFDILTKLKEIPEVVEADVLMGSFEILATVVAPTYNEISEIASMKIRKLKNIKSTITLNVVENQGFRK